MKECLLENNDHVCIQMDLAENFIIQELVEPGDAPRTGFRHNYFLLKSFDVLAINKVHSVKMILRQLL
jgi:hypothetical protein